MLAGGGGLAALENNVVSSYGEGVWWALSLMTTVGFVGKSPETTSGRVVSAVLMVSGFALMTLTTAALASLLVREEDEPDRVEERHFEHATHELLTHIAARLTVIEDVLGSIAKDGAQQDVVEAQSRPRPATVQDAGTAPGEPTDVQPPPEAASTARSTPTLPR